MSTSIVSVLPLRVRLDLQLDLDLLDAIRFGVRVGVLYGSCSSRGEWKSKDVAISVGLNASDIPGRPGPFLELLLSRVVVPRLEPGEALVLTLARRRKSVRAARIGL